MYTQSEISVSRLFNGKKLKRSIYPSFRKVEEESQRQTAKTYFPKSGQKDRHGIQQYQSVYERLAELLCGSRNEDDYGGLERVAASKNTNVYLEAVEEAENEGNKPKEVRNARMAGIQERKYPKRLLGYCGEWDINPHHNKRKTCTQGIL